MAPKSPWNKKLSVTKNTAAGAAPPPALDYGEAQTDEIEALRAIYMEDFEDVESKSAWSKTTDRHFKLRLRAFSDADSLVILSVQLTATYPRTLPLLEIHGLESYHERTQKRIRNILHNRPRQLVGDVMIHALASEVQDALEDAVQARQQGTLPSLEEERASAEEVATALAKEAEEAEARRRREVQQEEDRILKQMVNEEIDRREKRKPARLSDGPESVQTNTEDDGIVRFDQPMSLSLNNEKVLFNSLLTVGVISKFKDEEVLLAKPQVANSAAPVVALKLLTLQKKREELMELETLLETICSLRHSNVLGLLSFRIERRDLVVSRLIACYEHVAHGTMKELLELGNLHLSKTRQFTVQLLEALEYIHQNGIGHGNICPENIAITSTPVNLKLTGLGYPMNEHDQYDLPRKWQTPEGWPAAQASRRKSDIWQLGVLVVQMALGLAVPNEFTSPQLMLSKLELSASFEDFLLKTFSMEPRKRPSAFDLLPSEFLRTDDPVFTSLHLPVHHGRPSSSTGVASPLKRRSRHNSSIVLEPLSRYAMDFTEIGRLGKGGFGEVVKARNKLDGGIYAIKKIKQAPQLLDQVISEVMLLNRLNHPYVVRYFSTWVEEDVVGAVADDVSTTNTTFTATETATEKEENSDAESSDGPRMDFGYQSTGGLDFVSSNGFPQIEFGDDSDSDGAVEFANGEGSDIFEANEEAVESADDSEGDGLRLRKARSDSRRGPSMLYIQMEYCERHTLRDLIRKAIDVDDAWRYIRQITEGLSHIHGHGIIHRDLKPDNIFIDSAGNPKIGDFGLATTAQQHFTEKATTMSGRTGGELTRSVGTILYAAPELRSSSGTSYSDKVDMYSLGIIFFEMNEPFNTTMERIRALQSIRERKHELPAEFQPGKEKAAQGKLILCLISHKASERPSSTELLRSDNLPVKVEDEAIRQALNGLSDPRSPYHQKMMSALFSHDGAGANRVKAMAWDARASIPPDDASRLRLRAISRQTLEAIFKRHGAEEARRHAIFPRSAYNTNANVVQLLDAAGNLLQLPYDLTVPYARQLAQYPTDIRCTYSFGNAYRDAFTGGPPRVNEEVDFDIVSSADDRSRIFDDAELLKVVDEVVCEMPLFAATVTISFNLNHASLLGAILDYCRVPAPQQSAVKEILSRLGFNQCNWTKTRSELRKFGLPDTTLDDLQQFDFRDSPDKALQRVKSLLETASGRLRSRLETVSRSLHNVILVAGLLGVQRKIYVCPLASVKATFYEGGMLFQCVMERKANRVVVAAGGRYDSLIQAQRAADSRVDVQCAVGVAISLDFIINNMVRNKEGSNKRAFLKNHADSQVKSKRCDVSVVTGATDAVREAGIKIVASLWASDISAELATSERTAKEKEHSFVVTIRHEASNFVKVTNLLDGAEDNDVQISALVGHLQQELRERQSTKSRPAILQRQSSHNETERKGNVHVLTARHGSKKTNKYQIVSDAQQAWEEKLDNSKSAPILAVETRDDVLEVIQQTRFSDTESWRKAVQSVPLNERQYVQQIHDLLLRWRKNWTDGDGSREACVFNFRTQTCIYYDVGS